jgi:hypothetical protein
VFPPEEPTESGGQGWTLIVGSIRMQHQGTLGRGQVRGFVVGQGAPHESRRHQRDLIPVDEAQTMFGLDRNAVENIELRNLQDVFDRPELCTRRTENRCPYWQSLVRHFAAFIHYFSF